MLFLSLLAKLGLATLLEVLEKFGLELIAGSP